MSAQENVQYLERIVATQEYFVRAARRELEQLKSMQQPGPSDILRARAFIHAHAGMNDEAVAELNALVSESSGSNPGLLNKLAQVRLRRQVDDDVAAAEAAAARVLELPDVTAGDRWLAHQNLALARWSAGDLEGALGHAKQALDEVNDPRTRALLAHLTGGAGNPKSYAALGIPDTDLPGSGQSAPDVNALVTWVSRMEMM